jgi:predicted ArsR family transcriptional regulator
VNDKAEQALQGVAALVEPARRALYDYVVSRPDAVGREEAADAVGVSRQVAAFHLDRLVVLGLLDTERRRLTGRQGPGAGRPAKLYRRAARDFAVTVPPRRYDVAAQLLALAVERAVTTGTAVGDHLATVAREHGQRLGDAVRGRLRSRPSRKAVVAALEDTLGECGYEPRVVREGGADEVLLGNCPFDSLADRHRDLVCGMNLDLLGGVAEQVPGERVTARLELAAGACCVRLRVVR